MRPLEDYEAADKIAALEIDGLMRSIVDAFKYSGGTTDASKVRIPEVDAALLRHLIFVSYGLTDTTRKVAVERLMSLVDVESKYIGDPFRARQVKEYIANNIERISEQLEHLFPGAGSSFKI
jgi:hypothetical protein